MSLSELSRKHETVLWAKAAGRCSKCKCELVRKGEEDYYKIGENAHIAGKRPKAPRFDQAMSISNRADYQNHILLCANCHNEIDKDKESYPLHKLIEIKNEHENWVEEQLKAESNALTFDELSVIQKFLIPQSSFSISNSSLHIIPPKQKMDQNNLTESTTKFIPLGMLQYNLVKDYINKHPDVEFGNRLSNGFKNKYKELAKTYYGDELFNEMWEFASNYSMEFSVKAAGLAILTYFFQTCEIFES